METQKINFSTNVPVELALKFLEGKECESRFGSGKQYLFSTTDGRSFFVSDAVGNILHDQIRRNGVQPGEPIEIVKAEVDQGRGRKGIQWQVHRVGFAPGEQPDGTFAVPNTGAGARTPAPATQATSQQPYSNGNGSSNGQSNGNGNGHPTAAPAGMKLPPMKVPMNLAVIDAIRIVQVAMKETGEQWSDQSRQDLVSTILIEAGKQGWLAPWKLERAQ